MNKKVYVKVDKEIEPGDLVRCVRDDGECKPGDVRKVSQMGFDRKSFFYVYGSGEPLWQHHWEPVHKETRVDESSRAEMERAVAEMIVELLDRAERKKLMPIIYCYSNSVKNTRIYFDNVGYEANLRPDDKWDTLTGVFVALSKAAGRELPDWIYGEEK